MAKYQIISDSCSDYSKETDLSWIRRVPLTIELDGKQYVDTQELDCLDLIQAMKKSADAPHSACPAVGAWVEEFERAEGDIYVVTLSGALSGSCNSARVSADDFRQAHPDANIHVFDSRSAAAGQVLICLKIKEFADQGLPFSEVVEKTEAYISTMSTYFTLETLDVFRKNGRLNHLQSLVTGALRLKVVMRGTETGSIASAAKALTIQQALGKMVQEVKTVTQGQDLSKRILVITYVNCPERAETVRADILKVCSFGTSVLCRGSGISTVYGNDGGIIISF